MGRWIDTRDLRSPVPLSSSVPAWAHTYPRPGRVPLAISSAYLRSLLWVVVPYLVVASVVAAAAVVGVAVVGLRAWRRRRRRRQQRGGGKSSPAFDSPPSASPTSSGRTPTTGSEVRSSVDGVVADCGGDSNPAACDVTSGELDDDSDGVADEAGHGGHRGHRSWRRGRTGSATAAAGNGVPEPAAPSLPSFWSTVAAVAAVVSAAAVLAGTAIAAAAAAAVAGAVADLAASAAALLTAARTTVLPLLRFAVVTFDGLPPAVVSALSDLAAHGGGGEGVAGGLLGGVGGVAQVGARARSLLNQLVDVAAGADEVVAAVERWDGVAAALFAAAVLVVGVFTPVVAGVAASASSRAPYALGYRGCGEDDAATAADTPNFHHVRGGAAVAVSVAAAMAAVAAWAATGGAAAAAAGTADACITAAAWQSLLLSQAAFPAASPPVSPAAAPLAAHLQCPSALSADLPGLLASAATAAEAVRPYADAVANLGIGDPAGVDAALDWAAAVLTRLGECADVVPLGGRLVAYGCAASGVGMGVGGGGSGWGGGGGGDGALPHRPVGGSCRRGGGPHRRGGHGRRGGGHYPPPAGGRGRQGEGG